ncbi:MAG: NPCBM/NEW2 domain-containing protein, partial [Candidatus Poribacteria bacterium]|nr:NPCBM/NEW2 domain-containing protein [Candidatus Poribacteria bacterium]
WGQLWEKTPDGLVPRTPNGLFPADAFGGEDWTHFFYAHAPSRIVYDISGGNYESFHTHFHMPNLCGNSIDVTFHADTTEIYNAGILYIGRGTEIEFDIPQGTKTLTLKVDDLGDPGCDHFVLGEPTLTHRTLEPSTVIETPEPPITDMNADGTTGRTLLTLAYDSPDALTPTNPKAEWQTWGQLWEKTPDGLVPRTPNGLFPPNAFGGDNWKHFFYAHADSRIVWDISNKDYENFHAHFDMPNPCGNYAKLTVVFMADDTEIYNSGVLQGSEGRHSEITFDIPEGTEMLTLKVDDLGDPGCDHFVFGEPTLTHSVTTEPPITTTPTTTTSTAMGNTTVSLLPISVQSPNIGQLLKLSVKITDGKNVAGYQATVQFDDTALRYVESSNGDYLPDGAFFVPPILEGNLVRLNAASLAGESNGDGTLATLTFEVITVKASTLTLSDVLLSNSIGETFAPQIENAEITEPTVLKGDVNGDGTVNITDLVLVASNLGQTGSNAADVNTDGVVNIADLVLVTGALGTSASAPSLHLQALEMLTATEVKQWLSAAQQLNLTDMHSQRGILFLKQLLVALTPKETALLPNFPNPFNPETWIPYHLAKSADVTLHIYAMNGALVRTLTLGHQAAGKYQNRSRAAYWDGKNAFGEPVASGAYFYTLTAGDFTATRKMLIAK